MLEVFMQNYEFFWHYVIQKFTIRKFYLKKFCLKPGYLLNSKSRFMTKFTIKKFFTIRKFTIRKFDCTCKFHPVRSYDRHSRVNIDKEIRSRSILEDILQIQCKPKKIRVEKRRKTSCCTLGEKLNLVAK